ncbi:hypothetical protein [Clostridium sp. ZS2-4]|uniref:hypothetical protein n=1 Tax=Clostridium sp. ZS2-4 TaxID=2987703 RepID=UPI00227C4872|nr:hypothetical protein [Clostridium sp. ZS2-4]MCY6355001.1 hypothetical protein [Clostridium sp. ZS2-4]
MYKNKINFGKYDIYTSLLRMNKRLPQTKPIVFDECVIDLCKNVENFSSLFPYVDFSKKKIGDIKLEVVDIDFNVCETNGSKIKISAKNPNYIRIILSNIYVKILGKVVDTNSKTITQRYFVLKYLPKDEGEPGYNEETNPRDITVELYKPCQEFDGFIEEDTMEKKMLQQAINIEALSKLVKLNLKEDTADIKLTIYLRSVCFKKYKEFPDEKKTINDYEWK